MSNPYWQAKIWGLLHDPALKSLSSNFAREGQWELLDYMEGWRSPKSNGPKRGNCSLQTEWVKYIGLCDLIASASDRSTIGRLDPKFSAVYYHLEKGLQIRHLLSGEPLSIHVDEEWRCSLEQSKQKFLEAKETEFLQEIQSWDDGKKIFWALWRCYPQNLEEQEVLSSLLPAETRLPDGSLWSHVSMTSALAGALAGYYKTSEEYPQKNKSFNHHSRPYLVNFTFSPIQELIKSSRKIRDFWAGSWILHYLSAKICMAIANKYGPDCLLYPCLYQQPLIDQWLLKQYPDFSQWLTVPIPGQLLTAGFPNVIVMILPNNGKGKDELKSNPVYSAPQLAKQTLMEEWKKLGSQCLKFLQTDTHHHWPEINPSSWDYWLNAQWQTYWTAFPLGAPDPESLDCSLRTGKDKSKEDAQLNFENWCQAQSQVSQPKTPIFETNEEQFLKEIFWLTEEESDETQSQTKYSKQPNLNVGSWWAPTFDQLRKSLTTVKNARDWHMPTALVERSSISGIGPVVHPSETQSQYLNWPIEKEIKDFWSNQGLLFDGSEKLNATEVVKRTLHTFLPNLLDCKEEDIAIAYPDLSVGAAGYLKTCVESGRAQEIERYRKACQSISQKVLGDHRVILSERTQAWGLPFIDDSVYPELSAQVKSYHPRFLSIDWLLEDLKLERLDEETVKKYAQELKGEIEKNYPSNNPTDWYVVAAGDGDNMGEWLQGSDLKPYRQYLPDSLREKIEASDKIPPKYREPLRKFLTVKKRMGPATHSALSRALLDFSNQLVPYLTEQRYAGRLIYSGGDDVLAYTNLWEWDSWLWDIRQCFRGAEDPRQEFNNEGNYWFWQGGQTPQYLVNRPLFTMGKTATISFGLVLAHHSVPLAIALENLWEAETEAKEFEYFTGQYHPEENYACYRQKDAVQARVIYGNGNILKATCQFEVFGRWKTLIECFPQLDAALFEQAAQLLDAHPIPDHGAIGPWVNAFVQRREQLKALEAVEQGEFIRQLTQLIQEFWRTNRIDLQESAGARQQTGARRDQEIKNWLKLAAFVKRNRSIL